MARVPRHADKKGMTAALDLVEDALNKLQEKVAIQQQQAQYRDAETNTTPIQSEVPKTRRKKRKETSVLINHKPMARPGKSTQKKTQRKHRNSSRSDTSSESCGKPRNVRVMDDLGDSPEDLTGRSSKKRGSAAESSSDQSGRRKQHRTRDTRPRRTSREVAQDSSGVSPEGDVLGRRSRRGYARPTLTSKLRDELSGRREKDEKENVTPFIPCGSKGKSYHVGVIVQQELGRINNMTTKDLEQLRVPSPSSRDPGADRSDSEEVTEETVRRAMSNIEQHIALVKRHASKN